MVLLHARPSGGEKKSDIHYYEFLLIRYPVIFFYHFFGFSPILLSRIKVKGPAKKLGRFECY